MNWQTSSPMKSNPTVQDVPSHVSKRISFGRHRPAEEADRSTSAAWRRKRGEFGGRPQSPSTVVSVCLGGSRPCRICFSSTASSTASVLWLKDVGRDSDSDSNSNLEVRMQEGAKRKILNTGRQTVPGPYELQAVFMLEW